MSNNIRVLIADDQEIVCEGIQHILEREHNMEVVGVVRTAPQVLLQVRKHKPDILLLDLNWYGDAQAMDNVIAQVRQEYPQTCIIGLTGYEGLVLQAKAAGAQWAVTKYIGKNELVSLIRSVSEVVGPGELEEAWSASKHLRGLGTGHRYAADCEKDVYLILKTVLHPHLTNPRLQARMFGGGRRCDILFSNWSTHPFWQRVSQRHNATYIVFEVKNVKRPEVRYVDQVAGELTPGIGRLGFLVGRTRAEKPMLRRAMDVFNDDRKVVLFLCDDDLEEMLRIKEAGGEPTELIMKRYGDFSLEIN